MAISQHSCPVCDETARSPLYLVPDRHYHIEGEWLVAKCAGCGLVQLDPMLSNDELGKLYPEDFYAFSDIAAKRNTSIGRLKGLLFRSLEVEDPSFSRSGRVLDSGCGSGWALREFKDKGWECRGVEPNEAAVRFGREQYGLNLDVGTVNSVNYPSGHFDYVRSNHSLEHDPDAGQTLKEFRRIIRPDGKLLIGVPNIAGAAARLFGPYWYYLGAPVHTYNFSLAHLERLLGRSGFKVESVRYCGNWGGVIGSLQVWLNRHDRNRTASEGFLVNSTVAKVVGQIVSGLLNRIGRGDCIEVVARPVAEG